jgi:hypothetical protein
MLTRSLEWIKTRSLLSVKQVPVAALRELGFRRSIEWIPTSRVMKKQGRVWKDFTADVYVRSPVKPLVFQKVAPRC